ncbi:MAG: hypothetical protein CM1200mP2_23160 [Planctomycetaceae bacterium]|nr:MAG: hypothetical protein CM1200mP2_23160 [Planctomycetaceae bacterium]
MSPRGDLGDYSAELCVKVDLEDTTLERILSRRSITAAAVSSQLDSIASSSWP